MREDSNINENRGIAMAIGKMSYSYIPFTSSNSRSDFPICIIFTSINSLYIHKIIFFSAIKHHSIKAARGTFYAR